MSVNNVTLIGRLVKDVELKYSQNGVAMARFTLAVNRIKKSENGPDADFISILTFNKTAENVANYTAKGSLVAVVGSIQTGSYTNAENQKVYTTDVIAQSVQFLDSKKEQQPGQAQPQPQQMNQPQPVQQQQQYQQMNVGQLAPTFGQPQQQFDPRQGGNF